MSLRKQTIMIIHAEDTYNYGSFMMLINTIEYFAEKFNYECNFIVRLNSESDFKRLNEELNAYQGVNLKTFKRLESKFQGEERNKIKYTYNKILVIISRLLVDLARVIRIIRRDSVSRLVVLGGDNFNEYYKGWVISTNLLQIKILSYFTEVVLLGQTIGPFYSWRKRFAASTLRGTSIYCRDSLSVEYLSEKIGLLNNVFLSYDLAFLDLPKKGDDALDYIGTPKKSYITLVPSGLYKQYCPSLEAYLDSWERIIKLILERKDLQDKKIVLLPHVVNTNPNSTGDQHIVKMLKKRLKGIDRLVFIESTLLPSQARHILGSGLLTVTGRMHAAISSFQKGVPAIPVSYSVKYKGVVGDSLGRGDLIIEARDKHMWNSEDIAGLVNKKIDYVMNNYDLLKTEIEDKVEDIKDNLHQQLTEL